MADERELMWECKRWLGARRPLTAAEVLRAAADALPPDARPDRYGGGDFLEGFERRFAELLGKEAAALLPSGTMAQVIALRIHCDRRGRDIVAFHPTCHLLLHEHAAYAHLHGLKAELVGGRDRLIELRDLEAVHAPLGALLIELPQREIGGRLPEWDVLQAQLAWARERGVATHLDGARIWESAPYYGRSHAEIAEPFDTVYVSLYKALGGLAGSILAGPQDVIDEARVWQRRHGGLLHHMFPFAAAALRGLEEIVPQMPRLLEHARALAAAIEDVVTVVPDPPQTPLFHVHLRGDLETLKRRMREVSLKTGIWVNDKLEPTVVPNVHRLELNLGEPALDIAPDEARALFAEVVG